MLDFYDTIVHRNKKQWSRATGITRMNLAMIALRKNRMYT